MAQPPVPELEYVFTIRADIGSVVSGGKNASGERLHIPIVGGEVRGSKLNGTILPGGSDWPLIRPDGQSEISAHYTIMADDGTPIYVENAGLRVSSPAVLERLRAGEPVDPSDYYFRTAPRFDVADGPHAWLRRRLFVASAVPEGASVEIAVFVVG